MKKILRASVWISLFLTTQVFAFNSPHAITLTLADAYYHFSHKRSLKNTGMPNFSLAYNFDCCWAAEVGVGFLNTKQKSEPRRGVNGTLYNVNGIYRMPLQNYGFQPYVTAGIGVLRLTPNRLDAEHQGNVNIGVGLQQFYGDVTALRGELRDVYTFVGGHNDLMINLGVSFFIENLFC